MYIFSQCPKAHVMSGSWVREKEQKMAKGSLFLNCEEVCWTAVPASGETLKENSVGGA